MTLYAYAEQTAHAAVRGFAIDFTNFTQADNFLNGLSAKIYLTHTLRSTFEFLWKCNCSCHIQMAGAVPTPSKIVL